MSLLKTSFLTFLCLALISATKGKKPNIIFILADDLGWAELGCYGNSFNETPHLDQLAKEGLRFTDAYAAAPVCSPYRAALLTGQHPARVGILDYLRPNSSNALPVSHVTLPKILKENGYATGMVGKWHLTGYKYQNAQFEVRPNDHGFQWNTGSEVKGVGNGANFWPYVFRTQPISWIDIPKNRLGKNEYLTDRLNLEAVEFVERNQAQPFFLYLSHYAPHTILNGRPDLVEKYKEKRKPAPPTRDKCYLCQDAGLDVKNCTHWSQSNNPHLAAMLESIDDGIGLLTKKLKSLGILDDTIFIFSSDNGGETNVTSNAPLRGGKSQLYEGGIRVPLIIRWGNGGIPSGKICEQPVVNHDFYPTLLDAAGIKPKPEQKLDGVSTLATWRSPSTPPNRDSLFWHYPLDRPHFLGGVSSGAIRKGDWKLIEYFDPARTEKFELFNLGNDPEEKNNLASSKPEKTKTLYNSLKQWREGTGALVPSRPLLTEPRNLYFGEHFSKGQVSDRWFFQKEWEVIDGTLHRNQIKGENKRLFYKDPSFKNALIRFEFKFDGAQDIRLVTGSNGSYNTVVHIKKDHFFIQTAMDKRGSWFPMRHGECAYPFETGKWYVMTVEFYEDQVIAHLDHEHLAYGKHPMINQERTYLALQVDQAGACFDNLQVFGTARHSSQENNLQLIAKQSGKFPFAKTVQEKYKILKGNLHAILYMEDPKYQKMVKDVEELDSQKKELFPQAFRSHKDFQKQIQSLRKKLHQEDPVYKETLFATHRANRAIDQFLLKQKPSVEKLPASKQKAALERVRIELRDNPEYLKLIKASQEAQEKLESSYPELFVSNEEITLRRESSRKKLKDNPDLKGLVQARSQAYQVQEDYLHKNKELSRLKDNLD